MAKTELIRVGKLKLAEILLIENRCMDIIVYRVQYLGDCPSELMKIKGDFYAYINYWNRAKSTLMKKEKWELESRLDSLVEARNSQEHCFDALASLWNDQQTPDTEIELSSEDADEEPAIYRSSMNCEEIIISDIPKRVSLNDHFYNDIEDRQIEGLKRELAYHGRAFRWTAHDKVEDYTFKTLNKMEASIMLNTNLIPVEAIVEKEGPKWDRDRILNLLETNDKMVCRSLLVMYGRQTAGEQSLGVTNEENGIGFNGIDAPILTNIAQFYLKYGRLSSKQLDLVRKKLRKYVKQLVDIANKKEEEAKQNEA